MKSFTISCEAKSRRHVGNYATGLLLAGILLLTAVPVRACQIFQPMLQKSLADHLLDSQAVVMVKEDPNQNYIFKVVEVLKGQVDASSIELFLPSRLRLTTSARPNYTLLLGRKSQVTDWVAYGVAKDGDFEQVVREVLKEEEWVSEEKTNRDRVARFAKLIGHSDLRLHELGYLEVARAPYPLIMEVSSGISLDMMRAVLADYRYVSWHALATLVLGQSNESQDRAWLEKELDVHYRYSISRNLAALITAWIEMNGMDGLRHIEQLYVQDQDRTLNELDEVIMALSVQGGARPELQNTIVRYYAKMMRSHPELVMRFTKDLIDWQHWELIADYQQLEQQQAVLDPRAKFAIYSYLQAAGVKAKPQ